MPEENVNQNQTPQQPTSQANQTQDKNWLPDDMAETQLHARQVAQSQAGWQKEKHKEIKELRDFANSPEVFSQDGTAALELGMRNLGMPGVASSGRALSQLDKREEAMIEERSLREQDKSYLTLDDRTKQEAEARIFNGALMRSDWNSLYDYARYTDNKFSGEPASPTAKAMQRALKTMVENEIRLAAARDPKLGIAHNDNAKVFQVANKIASDADFLKMLNSEPALSPDISRIKFEIKKRITN